MKIIVLIVVQITFITFFNCGKLNAQQPEDCPEPAFVFVENGATFQGGNIDDFRNWVQENLVYPPEDLENNISGMVTVQFAINRAGHVINVEILRGATSTMDEETVRVILSSPEWEPARLGGRYVCQQFTIPVVFNLPE